jgi:DNA-binding LytR/AlgR family response regulator
MGKTISHRVKCFTHNNPMRMNHYPFFQESGVFIGAHTYAQVKEIIYCEGDRNYSHVHFLQQPTLMLSITLRILHERLGEQGFLRVNRSAVVNMDYIMHYDGREIILNNGLVLSIARRRRKQVELTLKPFFHCN